MKNRRISHSSHLAWRQTFSSIDTSAPVSTTFELAGAVADQSDQSSQPPGPRAGIKRRVYEVYGYYVILIWVIY